MILTERNKSFETLMHRARVPSTSPSPSLQSTHKLYITVPSPNIPSEDRGFLFAQLEYYNKLRSWNEIG